MKNLSIYSCLVILSAIVIFFTECNNSGSKNLNPENTEVQRINVNFEWYVMADEKGYHNEERGEAAAEVAVFSNYEKYIASGSRLGFNVRVWDEKREMVFDYHCDSSLEAVLFSPDDEFLLAGGEFNQLLIWKVDGWELYKTIQLPCSIESMRYSNNGKLLAIGRYDGMINLIETNEYNFVDSLLHGSANLIENQDFVRDDVNSLDFTTDDKYLLSGGFDGKLNIWYLPEMKLIKKIDAHEGSIKSVRLNKDDNCIATASTGEDYTGDNSIKLWDFKSGELLHKLSFQMGMESVEFSPSGNYLIGGGREARYDSVNSEPKGHIYFYSIPHNILSEPVRQIHKEQVFDLEHLCFNKDGSKILSSHQDGTVQLWTVHCN